MTFSLPCSRLAFQIRNQGYLIEMQGLDLPRLNKLWKNMWDLVGKPRHFSTLFFPECVARVPVSLWGLSCVRQTLRNRSQPFATIRNRSQPSPTVRNVCIRSQPFPQGRYGRAYGKFCKRGPCWSVPASHSFISRGRRGTS